MIDPDIQKLYELGLIEIDFDEDGELVVRITEEGIKEISPSN